MSPSLAPESHVGSLERSSTGGLGSSVELGVGREARHIAVRGARIHFFLLPPAQARRMYSPAVELRPFIEAVKAALLVEHPRTRKTPPDIGVLPPLPYRDEREVGRLVDSETGPWCAWPRARGS